jgi:hypothetical protein
MALPVGLLVRADRGIEQATYPFGLVLVVDSVGDDVAGAALADGEDVERVAIVIDAEAFLVRRRDASAHRSSPGSSAAWRSSALRWLNSVSAGWRCLVPRPCVGSPMRQRWPSPNAAIAFDRRRITPIPRAGETKPQRKRGLTARGRAAASCPPVSPASRLPARSDYCNKTVPRAAKDGSPP